MVHQFVTVQTTVFDLGCISHKIGFVLFCFFLFSQNTWYWVLPILRDSLQWRHNGRDGVSNHQPHDCLLNHLFRHRSKKTSKLRVTGLCAGNSPGTGEFPTQKASYAENVSIWWRHHEVHVNNDAFVTSDLRCIKSVSIVTADALVLKWHQHPQHCLRTSNEVEVMPRRCY